MNKLLIFPTFRSRLAGLSRLPVESPGTSQNPSVTEPQNPPNPAILPPPQPAATAVHYAPGKLIVHMGIVPNGGQTQFVAQRLQPAGNEPTPTKPVLVLHTLGHSAYEHIHVLPPEQPLWHPDTLNFILKLNPGLVILPQLSQPQLTPEQHAQHLAHVQALLNTGITVETSLAIMEVARVNDLLKPKVDWPAHAAITGDFLRQHVGDYLLHDDQPQALLNQFYQNRVILPAHLAPQPTALYNLGNLTRLREAMLKLVNAQASDAARFANPEQINLSAKPWASLTEITHQLWLTLAANLSFLVMVHMLWINHWLPTIATGVLLLAAPLVTALRTHPITASLSTLASFIVFNHVFLPDFSAVMPTLTSQVIGLGYLLGVVMLISFMAHRQQRRQQQQTSQATLLRSLLRLTYDLSYAESSASVVKAAISNLKRTLQLPVVLVQPHGAPWPLDPPQSPLDDTEKANAILCMSKNTAIPPTPGTTYLWFPLNLRHMPLGAIGLQLRRHTYGSVSFETMELLRAFTDLMVTALRRMQLREARDMATQDAERESLRATLLSAISHDLKTPLVSIIGSLSTLRHLGGQMSPADRDELLQTAHEEAERLHSIIHNVLELTRVESGSVKPNLIPIDMEGVAETLRTRIKRYYPGLPFTIIRPTPSPWVLADPLLLEEVLFNLIDNCAKYAGPTQPVTLKLSANATEVEVQVADHGPGIPENQRERVFDKYFRSQQGDSHVAGSGLGLAIAKALITACQGRIWASARADGHPGTVMHLALPRAEALSLENEAQAS